MLEFSTQGTSEAQLAALLGDLLEGEGTGGDGTAGRDVPAEIAEMRDVARLLRAASQSVPLPEGRLAVRRALLATLEPPESERFPARAAWRRTGRWLGVAAMAGMIIAAFGLGAGLLDHVGTPSSPLYGLRRAVDRVRLAFVPGRPEGGPSPFVSQVPRIPETGNVPPSGVPGPAGMGGYPLSIQFSGVTLPSVPGQEVTLEGTVGGLPVTLALTATTGCPAGGACGTFEAWVTPLRGTKASPEFGQMRGTFICASAQCTMMPVSKTGVFNTTSAFVLQRNGSGEFAGLVRTGFDSLGDWVATVAQVAQKLNAEDLLPPGVTVKELVNDAASNKVVPKRQGMSGGSAPGFAGVGAPTADGLLGTSAGTGIGAGPSPGAVNTSSVGVSVPSVGVSVPSVSVSVPSVSVTGTGTTVTLAGGVTIGAPSTPSTSGTTSGTIGGGTPSGGGTPGGGGISVGVGGIGVGVGGGGVGGGGGTGSGDVGGVGLK